MQYVLTAQPIADDGSIGFDNRGPVEVSGRSIDDVFRRMALELGGTAFDESEPYAHTEVGAAWDLTLTVVRS